MNQFSILHPGRYLFYIALPIPTVTNLHMYNTQRLQNTKNIGCRTPKTHLKCIWIGWRLSYALILRLPRTIPKLWRHISSPQLLSLKCFPHKFGDIRWKHGQFVFSGQKVPQFSTKIEDPGTKVAYFIPLFIRGFNFSQISVTVTFKQIDNFPQKLFNSFGRFVKFQ